MKVREDRSPVRKMKPMVLHRFNRPLRLEEVEIPTVGPGEILVKVKACGLCASELARRYQAEEPK